MSKGNTKFCSFLVVHEMKIYYLKTGHKMKNFKRRPFYKLFCFNKD